MSDINKKTKEVGKRITVLEQKYEREVSSLGEFDKATSFGVVKPGSIFQHLTAYVDGELPCVSAICIIRIVNIGGS